jgi:hypothetical protein
VACLVAFLVAGFLGVFVADLVLRAAGVVVFFALDVADDAALDILAAVAAAT